MKHRRGWRLLKRFPVEIDVSIGDKTFLTENVGNGGMQVYWPDCDQPVNAPLKLAFNLSGEEFQLVAGVAVRTTDGQVGIAFRDLDGETKKRVTAAVARSQK